MRPSGRSSLAHGSWTASTVSSPIAHGVIASQASTRIHGCLLLLGTQTSDLSPMTIDTMYRALLLAGEGMDSSKTCTLPCIFSPHTVSGSWKFSIRGKIDRPSIQWRTMPVQIPLYRACRRAPLQQSSLFLPSFTARQSFSRLQVFKAVQGCSMDCALAPCDLFRQQATGTGSSAKVPKFPCQKCTFSILRARHDMMTYAGTK